MIYKKQEGMTLIEISVVLLILIALAGLTVPYLAGLTSESACKTTDISLSNIRDIITGKGQSNGYLQDNFKYPDQMNDLFSMCGTCSSYSPERNRGWRGPYIMNGYSISTDLDTTNAPNALSGNTSTIDGWGNPIFIQIPEDNTGTPNRKYIRVISAGRNRTVDTVLKSPSVAQNNNTLEAASRGDDRVIFLKVPDVNYNQTQSCDNS